MHLKKRTFPIFDFICILCLVTRSYSCNFLLGTYYVGHWSYVNGRSTLFSTKTLACLPRVRQIVGSSPGQIKPKTKNNRCCFSDKHATKKGWLGIGIMCLRGEIGTCGLLFQWASTIRIGLVQSGHHYHFFECDFVLAIIKQILLIWR